MQKWPILLVFSDHLINLLLFLHLKATGCQKPVEATSEDVTEEVKEEQSED